jgi:hypothetical protein
MSGIITTYQKMVFDDDYYHCVACGGGNHSADPLVVVQTGGDRNDWAHGHCYAKVDVEFALEDLKKALRQLERDQFNARKAVKYIDASMRSLRSARDCLTGNALWPDLR